MIQSAEYYELILYHRPIGHLWPLNMAEDVNITSDTSRSRTIQELLCTPLFRQKNNEDNDAQEEMHFQLSIMEAVFKDM